MIRPALNSTFLLKSKFVLTLIMIGSIAAVFAFASYLYSAYVTEEIRKVAAEDIRSNSRIQAHDLSKVLVNKVEPISRNLVVVSNVSAFYDPGNIEVAKPIMSGVQEATKDLTDFYVWLDADGKIVWLSNINSTTYEQFKGTDLSYRPYFTEPRNTLEIYYSTAVLSNDSIPRIYISHPILDEQGDFKGILAAAVSLQVLGKYLESQLSPEFQSSIGMMDRNGVILYTDDLSDIGQDAFGEQFQAALPEGLRQDFNAFLRRSLSGGSGAEDLTFGGSSGTLAYETISIGGKDFAVIYIVAAHNFAGNVSSLIDQQRNFSTIIIIAVGAVAVGISILFLTWNKRLDSLVRTRTEELERAVMSLRDANEQLTVHDKMQKEFINIAAHELRTPTQAILGNAELLQSLVEPNNNNNNNNINNNSDSKPHLSLQLLDDGEVNEMIHSTFRNASRLQRLTEDILNVTRIESNSLKLNLETFDINQKIRNVISDVKGTIRPGQNIHLEFRQSTAGAEHADGGNNGKILVNADKTKVFEILSNLIRNAIKFTDNGSIIVTAEKNGQEVVIKVKDTGKGIDPEIMPKLFTKFATKSESGTGLGLFIAKSLVEAHGGRIWAENNNDIKEGNGATFTFTLPCL